MKTPQTDRRLGSQIWLERTDDIERVEYLVDRAVSLGIGQLRTFLMWPWIQAVSEDSWDFTVFDHLFAVAADRGVVIKATLTANSGPWWLGTPSVLHSHTLVLSESWWPHIEAYVTECVTRYAKHPALAQWILWNEPFNARVTPGSQAARPESSIRDWRSFLDERYPSVSALNERWRTGYSTFQEVPLAEDVAHVVHSDSFWRSFAPELDDRVFRAHQLEGQLLRIAGLVRDSDPTTPTCINPNQTLSNQAAQGYRLTELSKIVDVMGASFHAPWHFTFAEARDDTSLVIAGVTLLSAASNGRAVEVTEVQTGNTFYAGKKALGVDEAEIAATYLAPLLAGATSVTGWCLNTRSQDFEAGEWGLLDDLDQPGPRALALLRVRDTLLHLDQAIGEWHALGAEARVLCSEESHAVQQAIADHSNNPFARDADVAAQGSALIAVELERIGIRASLTPLASLAGVRGPHILIAPAIVAWSNDTAQRLLETVERGSTLLIDGISGQFDLDASLHRPWPGGFEAAGIRSAGLQTDSAADDAVGINLLGKPYCQAPGVRSNIIVTDSSWAPVGDLTYAEDAQPVLWQRSWGAGQIFYCTAALAQSSTYSTDQRLLVTKILHTVTRNVSTSVQPLSATTTVLKVRGPDGDALGVFAPPIARRLGRPMAIRCEPGTYSDLWNGQTSTVSNDGIFRSWDPEGIAVLLRRDNS